MTNHNVTMLNNKVVTLFTFQDPLKNIVIVQRIKTRHMINRVQSEQFARQMGRDLTMFLAQHLHTKNQCPGSGKSAFILADSRTS